MHTGVIFFRTTRLDEVSKFYQEQIGCTLWLDQGGCHILKYGTMLFGFCQRDTSDLCGMITFVYPGPAGVDQMHQKLSSIAEDTPKDNSDYRIYHFFAKDPEGRAIEFQYFWDEHLRQS